MRVGFDGKRAFHNFRGLGNYARNLLEGFEHYYPDNDYFVYGPPPKDERGKLWLKKHPKLELRVPTSFLGKTFSSAWRSVFLDKVISKDHLDLYHGLSHEIPLGLPKLDIKSIVTIHDLLFLKIPEYFKYIDRQVYLKKITFSCANADTVVAICEQTKRDLIEHLNVPEEKIKVVYQSCNQNFYNPLSVEKLGILKEKYNLPDNYILYVGAISKAKNIEAILKAYQMLSKDHKSKFDLILVGGSSDHQNELIELSKILKIDKRIRFLNNVPNSDMPGIYQLSDLFVFPSFYEGFGIPIIEALFSRVPVITSKGSCFPEAGGEYTQYIDPYNPEELSNMMSEVLENDVLKEQMIREGRKFVEKFHRSHTVRNMWKVYQDTLNP